MSTLSNLVKFLKLPTTEDELQQAQRLFHGRGHAYEDLHHITIDWLPPVLLITLFSPEPQSNIETLADKLLALLPCCKSIQLQHRYQLSGPIDIIRGESIPQLLITENDLQFSINLGQARNTGLFLDMQNGRRWVQAHSDNKRVLNLFSYTCGFSVAAIA
ncbi:MAG: methyltransferase, partial [Methylococcaceae bacterium]|nr:methyltransferase [Methylococcaceae bacterium]